MSYIAPYPAAYPVPFGYPAAAPAYGPVLSAAGPALVASAGPIIAAPIPIGYGSYAAPLPAYGLGSYGSYGSYGASRGLAPPPPPPARPYYGQGRRTAAYGELLYQAPIYDDRYDAPAAAAVAAPADASRGYAAASTGNSLAIEVVSGRGLPKTSGGFLKKDILDPYVIVKVGGATANTSALDNAGSNPTWNTTLTLNGTAGYASGQVEVYDCDGNMSAVVPKSSDDFIGRGSFPIRVGEQIVRIVDVKGATKGEITIRVKAL